MTHGPSTRKTSLPRRIMGIAIGKARKDGTQIRTTPETAGRTLDHQSAWCYWPTRSCSLRLCTLLFAGKAPSGELTYREILCPVADKVTIHPLHVVSCTLQPLQTSACMFAAISCHLHYVLCILQSLQTSAFTFAAVPFHLHALFLMSPTLCTLC